jgi:hypothetical protein
MTAKNSSGKKSDPLSFVTPRKAKKPLRLGQDSPSEDSWEGVPSNLLNNPPTFVAVDLLILNSPSSTGGRDINVKRALEGLQENFSALSDHLTTQSTMLSNNFNDMTYWMNAFALSGTSLDRRVGEPHGFGADGAVTSAFDGL